MQDDIIMYPFFLLIGFTLIAMLLKLYIVILIKLYSNKKENDKKEYKKLLDERINPQDLKIVFIKIEEDDLLKKTGQFRLVIDHLGKEIFYYLSSEVRKEFNVLDGFCGNMTDLRYIFPKKFISIYKKIYNNI